MRFFKLPAALRWGLVNCFIILMMMSVYRLIIMSLLTDEVFTNAIVIQKGLLLDFGAVSIVGFLFILCSFIPAFHPYKSKNGMYFGLVFFSFFGMFYALIYGLDLVFIKTVSSRISSNSINVLFNSPTIAKEFRGNIPYLALTSGVILLVWVWWILIEWLYRTLGTIARSEEKIIRLFWQSFCLAIFLYGFVRASEHTSALSNEAILINGDKKVPFSANPVLTLFFK